MECMYVYLGILIMPYFSLQEEKPYISVGCCVDLLPLVKLMLKSKFEE